MPKYRYLEGVAVADLAFEAFGNDLNELFENAAMAMLSAQADLKTVDARILKEVDLENADIVQLLFDFLNEIIFYKDAEQLIFKTVKANIVRNKAYKLHAEFKGEIIDTAKHKLGNDLKAVTMHLFKVEKTKTGWKCTVVVDI